MDWQNILFQTKQWKHLKRRKYIKKLKRSIRRRKAAEDQHLANNATFNVKAVDFNLKKSVSDAIDTYGFSPVYDFLVQETVLTIVQDLVNLVCKNKVSSDEVVPSSKVSASPCTNTTSDDNLVVTSININDSSRFFDLSDEVLESEDSEVTHDIAKTVATDKFLEELDVEVKRWHNPFLPEHSQNSLADGNANSFKNNSAGIVENSSDIQLPSTGKPKEICRFYDKVGSCRFGDNCSRHHEKVDTSNTLLLRGMFSTFAFDIVDRAQKTLEGDVDDIWLEHSDTDLYDEFVEFYNDVIPELETYGSVVQFKVCCNRDKHLLGNVYVQYKHQRDAEKAAQHLNGRYYGGKPLSVKYVLIKSWKSAICGLHYNSRNCQRGYHCNFLHVFKEPSRRFYDADTDFKKQEIKNGHYSEESLRRRHFERSYYRERSHKRTFRTQKRSSSSPSYHNSPKVKKSKKSSKEHKRSTKKHSKKRKHKKDKDNSSS